MRVERSQKPDTKERVTALQTRVHSALRPGEILSLFDRTEGAFIWSAPGKPLQLAIRPRMITKMFGSSRIERWSESRGTATERNTSLSLPALVKRESDILFHPDFPIFGFTSYDAARHLERIRGFVSDITTPTTTLVSPKQLLSFENEKTLLVTSIVESREDENVHRIIVEKVSNNNESSSSPSDEPVDPVPKLYHSKETFEGMVAKAKDYIVAGDAFQIVLSNVLTLLLSPCPFRLFDALRETNPSPYNFLYVDKNKTYVGASPEVMFRSEGIEDTNQTKLSMRLVAGTYPAEPNEQQDSAQKTRLVTDPKECAEHMMLVDHVRNDIGRVAKIASVNVDELLVVESYRDLHHIVSQVSGILRPELSIWDGFFSCFPIATLTGTPKIRAMEIISELEGLPRGVFGGSFFLLSDTSRNELDSCVAIRFIEIEDSQSVIHAGAGIVYDSDPEREFRECLLKAEPILRASRMAFRA